MQNLIERKPIAIANWKMAMTVSEGLVFVKKFKNAVEDVAQLVNIVICPPYTSIYPLSQALMGTPIQIGAQNLCAAPQETHTGEISAPLLFEAGCRWVMLGHWEVRRRTGETDADIRMKMNAAFKAGLRPILLTGENADEHGQAEEVLTSRLQALFEACEPGHAAQVAIIYEPEWAIGAEEPAAPDYIDTCFTFIRGWIEKRYDVDVANALRLIYGGSVTSEHAGILLASKNVDGLGAGRQGRDPIAFAQIVHQIVAAKGLG